MFVEKLDLKVWIIATKSELSRKPFPVLVLLPRYVFWYLKYRNTSISKASISKGPNAKQLLMDPCFHVVT